jgi:hypothetical protein
MIKRNAVANSSSVCSVRDGAATWEVAARRPAKQFTHAQQSRATMLPRDLVLHERLTLCEVPVANEPHQHGGSVIAREPDSVCGVLQLAAANAIGCGDADSLAGAMILPFFDTETLLNCLAAITPTLCPASSQTSLRCCCPGPVTCWPSSRLAAGRSAFYVQRVDSGMFLMSSCRRHWLRPMAGTSAPTPCCAVHGVVMARCCLWPAGAPACTYWTGKAQSSYASSY